MELKYGIACDYTCVTASVLCGLAAVGVAARLTGFDMRPLSRNKSMFDRVDISSSFQLL